MYKTPKMKDYLLSVSLYFDDDIWIYHRHRKGYRQLQGPLILKDTIYNKACIP